MYRTISTEMWTDEKLSDLEFEVRALFPYLITNRHTHVTGIYYLPISLIHEETGLSIKKIIATLKIFEERRIVYYDHKKKVVFVTKMMPYQSRGSKIRKSAVVHLRTLRDSVLIGKFLQTYPDIPFEYTPKVDSPEVQQSLVVRAINPPSLVNGHDYTTDALEVMNFLIEKTGRKFRAREANGKPSSGLEFILARLKSGVDVQTCKTLIMRKVRDWREDPKMMKYLRPQTLFNRTNFESYLGEVSQ